ncbi:hypothetical protein SAMN05421863_105514 [Nitrosomonas communis]|uniref:Uncharacterized protein n=1 Tax=Nitrosomonas communis TaxID=44574 RepID=A0A1I4TVD7_9PROT|nr:hypothetical protein SAMN05421863_105514 [Nitrosomonas communis]
MLLHTIPIRYLKNQTTIQNKAQNSTKLSGNLYSRKTQVKITIYSNIQSTKADNVLRGRGRSS